MAQRTGAKRFLAPIIKATSAGGALALVAVIALSGCGGGTGDPTVAGAQSTAIQDPKGVSALAGADAPSPSEEEQRRAASAVKQSGKRIVDSEKRGPSIAVPKGGQEAEISPEQRANSTVASITLTSPVTASGSPLPATYTCDGKNLSPPLDWADVPVGTTELVLFLMNVQPVEEQIFFDWAVAGLDPAAGGVPAGRLPSSAILGKNSFGQSGYSVCPPQGQGETYMFVLYALLKALSPKQGFDPLSLREEILQLSGNAGLFAVTYPRG